MLEKVSTCLLYTSIQDMNSVMDTYELFRLTGCQCNRTYTLPQLYSYRAETVSYTHLLYCL